MKEAETIANEAALAGRPGCDFEHESEDDANSAGASVGEAAIGNEDNEDKKKKKILR